jgi:hypothetical protein
MRGNGLQQPTASRCDGTRVAHQRIADKQQIALHSRPGGEFFSIYLLKCVG